MFNLVIPSLTEQEPDIAVIHIRENDANYKNSEDIDIDELLRSIVYIGKNCSQSAVIDIVFSGILAKKNFKVI